MNLVNQRFRIESTVELSNTNSVCHLGVLRPMLLFVAPYT